MTVAQLLERVRSYLGTPFHHQGRSRHGVDCVGLIECALRDGGALPAGYVALRNYGRRGNGELIRQLERWCAPAPAVAPGVLITMRWRRQDEPHHVAIAAGETIVHARDPRDSARAGVVEVAYRGIWPKRAVSCWYLPGVDYE